MMGWQHGWQSGWGMMGGGLFMWLLLILAVVLVVWAIRAAATNSTRSGETGTPALPSSEAPLDILKRRYANGEINHEDYEKMQTDLQQI